MSNSRYPAIGEMVRSQDFVEGPKAFAEKRKPQLEGKVKDERSPTRATSSAARASSRRCCERMLARGFAATSLADVARAAHMTPSHLLYYFKGKDAILNACFEGVTAQIMSGLRAARRRAARPRGSTGSPSTSSAASCSTRATSRSRSSSSALAVHDKDAARDQGLLRPRGEGLARAQLRGRARARRAISAENAAEAAYAMIVGLSHVGVLRRTARLRARARAARRFAPQPGGDGSPP